MEELRNICKNCYQKNKNDNINDIKLNTTNNINYDDDDAEFSQSSEKSYNIHDQKYERFSEWIHCMCVVTFDLELGQAMELIYPEDVTLLSEQEKTNICYLAFPDSNSGCMGDTQFHIRLRLSPDNIESLQLNYKQKLFNSQCIPVQKPDLAHYWGFVYFRQKKDTTITRGYFQKSFIILTRLPFFNLFNEIVSKIAPQYFNDGITVLQSVYEQISTWPSLKAGEQFSLHLLGTVYQTIIPNTNRKIHSTTTTTTATTNNINYNMTTMNNEFNEKLCKYCNEKFNDNNDNELSLLYNDNIIVGPTLPPQVLTSVHEIDIFHSLSYNITNIYTIWELVLICEPIVIIGSSPADCSHMVQSIISLISPLEYLAESRPYFTIHDSEFKEFTSYKCNKNNNINTTSNTNISKNQIQLSSTSFSDDITTTTTTTTTLTNNNQNKPPSIIIGVTNPFFMKLLQNWPHMIKLPDTIQPIYPILSKYSLTSSSSTSSLPVQQQNSIKKKILINNTIKSTTIKTTNIHNLNNISSTNSTIGNVSNIINSTINGDNYNIPGLHTKYKSYLKKDKNLIKKIQLGIKMKRPEQVQSAILRRHFLELTQSFMIPLERYMASLMPLQKDISPFKSAPNPNQFKQDDFLSTLELSGPQLTTSLKGNWKGLYKRFFKSPNFKGWYENRHKELKHTLQALQIKALSDADLNQWAQGKQEVEIIDMILKLKQKLKLCSDSELIIDDVLITKIQLNKQLDNITQSLPDDLKNIINNSS